jgi:hypothetical protein
MIVVTFQEGKVIQRGFTDVKGVVDGPKKPDAPQNHPGLAGVSKLNYERVQVGMTQAEVEAILGPPSNKNGFVLEWKEPGQVTPLITIHLHDGKVGAKFAGPNLK